jgi:hypothetical protein
MCLRRAPEKYIAGAKAPPGAALDRAGLDLFFGKIENSVLSNFKNCDFIK